MHIRATLASLAIFAAVGPAAATVLQTFDFSPPVTLSATQAPGTWYTDRYAPAGFASSGGELVQTISAADSATNRPGAYSSSFYNTQGRKYDLDPGATGMSIDLFVNSAWATSGQRMAGFWGTAFDATNSISAFPILEFTSDSGNARFRGWDSNGAGSWVDFGLPGGFTYDTFHELGVVLDTANNEFDYSLDGLALGSVSALGSTYIGNVILQGHNNFGPNTTQGAYSIRWDNLEVTGGTVPEPSTLAVLVFPLLFAVATARPWGRRRENNGDMSKKFLKLIRA